MASLNFSFEYPSGTLTDAEPNFEIEGANVSGIIETMGLQLTGTDFDGGTVAVQVSNDGTTYTTGTDSQGNALTLTSAGTLSCLTSDYAGAYRYFRLHLSGSSGSAEIPFYLSITRA